MFAAANQNATQLSLLWLSANRRSDSERNRVSLLLPGSLHESPGEGANSLKPNRGARWTGNAVEIEGWFLYFYPRTSHF
jgi:hypothetical protein